MLFGKVGKWAGQSPMKCSLDKFSNRAVTPQHRPPRRTRAVKIVEVEILGPIVETISIVPVRRAIIL